MPDYTANELSYLIQEGQGSAPEVIEALITLYGPGVYLFAQDLLPDGPEHTADALALTTASFQTALGEPDRLQFFDSPQTWLYATSLELARKFIRPSPVLERKLHPSLRVTLLLRFRHHLSLGQIAEITGKEPEHIHTRFTKWRKQNSPGSFPRGRNHRADEILQALDGLIPWHDQPRDEHLRECPECRSFLGDMQDLENAVQSFFEDHSAQPFTDETRRQILQGVGSHPKQIWSPAPAARTREIGWLSAAIVAFLLISLYLNPIWTPRPDPPTPTPTPLPAVEPLSRLIETDYAALTQAIQFSPLPIWELADTLSGDWEPTTRISVSEDGHYGAFGSENILILWDLHVDIQIPLGGHSADILQVEFSGRDRLASLDGEGNLRLWDVGTRSTRYVLSEDHRAIRFAFSQDGSTLAAASVDSIALWRFQGEDLVRFNRIPQPGSTRIALSSAGALLAAANPEGIVSVWEIDTYSNELRFQAQEHPDLIRFAPTGNRLAIQALSGNIEVFDVSKPLDSPMNVTLAFTFQAPSVQPDFTWLPDARYIAAPVESETTVDGLRAARTAVHFWEMSTGLPARLPLELPSSGSPTSIQLTGDLTMTVGTNSGLLYMLPAVSLRQSPPATEFNQSSGDLFPAGIVYQSSTDPFNQAFVMTLESAANRIALDIPLGEIIPEEFTFQGAAFDEKTGIASFAFTRTMAPSRDEEILLRIRTHIPGRPLTLREDWIGAQIELTHIQIGKFLGEFVKGEWVQADIDRGAAGVFRWVDSPTARYRWSQGDYLIELISRSEIATERIRWNRLFQPLATAVIGTDEHTALIDYQIEDGDTCFGIAARFGTTVERLSSLNLLDDNCTIFSGDSLQVPVPPAVGIFAEEDLNCDGSPERLRTIPDPLQPSTAVYFGIVLEAIPEGGSAPEATFAPYASLTVADIDVTFFDVPALVEVDDVCGKLIFLTGYGGTGVDSGLRVYVWTGNELRLLLNSDGFLEADIPPGLNEEGSFTTQRLTYDEAAVSCALTRTTFTWTSNGFVESAREIIPGQQCFSPPNNDG